MAICTVRVAALSLAVAVGACTRVPARAGQGSVESTTESPRATESLQLSRAEARKLLCAVMQRLDLDGDKRLTVDDRIGATVQLSTSFAVGERASPFTLELTTIQQASLLVQELVSQLEDSAASEVTLRMDELNSSIVDQLLKQIDGRFWSALTRRVEPSESSLREALRDQKMGEQARQTSFSCAEEGQTAQARAAASTAEVDGSRWLYVPASDPDAVAAYESFASQHRNALPWLSIGEVPVAFDAAWVKTLTSERKHGLLTMALEQGRGKPFVVPGGRFNEMYGWDSFFIVWGLAASSGHSELSRAMVDNFAYQIRHYRKILNANRTYYLTRSQPPFFTQMIERAWESSPDSFRRSVAGTSWLTDSLKAALREYDTVWSQPPRLSDLCQAGVCLARYHGTGRGQPPEVEEGHFAWAYQTYAKRHKACPPGDEGRFIECAAELGVRYRRGELDAPWLDEFFVHDRCMRESGHDTTYRWFDPGSDSDRCADFATVDLNTLLLRYELDLAEAFHRGLLPGDRGEELCQRALSRAQLMKKHLWDADEALFYDVDTKERRRRQYLSATTLFPLWLPPDNACGVRLLNEDESRRLVASALPGLEQAGGLSASAERAVDAVPKPSVLRRTSDGVVTEVLSRQWDFPNGWAPHQMLAWEGLEQWGFEAEAHRLAYRWLYTIARNAADYHGTVPEKFDVVRRTHKVFQEYGNVNTEFAYITQEGFGWMNASFVVGFELLAPGERQALRKLVPPESL